MSNYRNFNETVLKEVEQECRKYNYHAELRFDEIHIRTKFESWYFVPNENGIIKLMHGNTVGHFSERFHTQFSRKMSYKDMVQYIHEHETAKYTNNVFVFTFTKTGGVNVYAWFFYLVPLSIILLMYESVIDERRTRFVLCTFITVSERRNKIQCGRKKEILKI